MLNTKILGPAATLSHHRDAAPWIEMGVDLIFCANDIVCLRNGASEVMRETSALRTRSELAGAR